MNTLLLGRCLGDLTPQSFQRLYFQQQFQSLNHNVGVHFTSRPQTDKSPEDSSVSIAHRAGTNCIAIDQSTGRYLVSGGADTSISLWDLGSPSTTSPDGQQSDTTTAGAAADNKAVASYHPVSTISKATPNSHSHAITSLSIYPFDPVPQTLLTTSYDQSIILHSIADSGTIKPLHKFPLEFTAHTHSVCPIADSSTPLVAVGTSHPAPRLIDLRSALATHSLPGHTGAIYSLAWHPTKSHILVSSSTDGRILVFDIRRATPAFASFDVDDSLGVIDGNHTPNFLPTSAISVPGSVPSRPHLSYTHRAHSAPITGIIFNSSGTKLISASHDQRIRTWDVASGRNDLAHFGPRIRNSRAGELRPSLAPLCTFPLSGSSSSRGSGSGSREVLFWPNDDGRGEIHVHDLHEGTALRVMKTSNMVLLREQQSSIKKTKRKGRGPGGRDTAGIDRLTSGGRINAIAWRPVWAEGKGGGVEMYTAHGDGRICAWMPGAGNQDEDEDEDKGEESDGESSDDDEDGEGEETGMKRKKKQKLSAEEEEEAERKRKRKRDLIGNLVEGLTKRPVTFS